MNLQIFKFPGRAVCVVFLLLIAMFLTLPAHAQTPAQAREALQTAVNKIMDNIKNPAYANPATRGPLREAIKQEVYGIFDFDEFSSRTVGQRWRKFSPEVKQDFSNAFANLLFNTYLNKITGYNGEQVSYTGEVASPDGKIVEVRTNITMKDGKVTPVAYRMLNKNGRWRVFDVIIENISLVKNYRTQFQSILNTATPEQLIARINEKAREVIAQGAANEKGQ